MQDIHHKFRRRLMRMRGRQGRKKLNSAHQRILQNCRHTRLLEVLMLDAYPKDIVALAEQEKTSQFDKSAT